MKRILAMSFPRKKVLDRMSSYSKEINQHIIECVVYKNILSDTLNHWISEISAWMSLVNKQKCDSKLKELDYKNSLFSDFGEDVDDAEVNLMHYCLYNRKNKEYPDFEVTTELAIDLAKVYDKFEEISLSILLGDQKLSSTQWKTVLKDIFM